MNWKHPNTITGVVAEGEKYFGRPKIEKRLWREIAKSNHVLFLAPRRVGKSSIVKYLAANPIEGHYCIYENIQSDKSIDEFYKRLCSLTLKCLNQKEKLKTIVDRWISKYKITSIGLESISFDSKDLDYRQLFFEMLHDLRTQKEKVVLILDEFPDVVNKIGKKFGQDEAVNLLDDLRRIRHDDEFRKVFVMIILGSIGLDHIVMELTGRIDKINDFHNEYLGPIEESEIKSFLSHLLKDATMQVSDKVASHIINKIGYAIPYYIQLIIEECDDLLYDAEREELTVEDVETAYNRLLLNSKHFTDWESRLKEYFNKKTYTFLMDILYNCVHQNGLDLLEVYNIAVRHKLKDTYKGLIDDILIKDGYITYWEEKYIFNSPILRDWWKARHPKL